MGYSTDQKHNGRQAIMSHSCQDAIISVIEKQRRRKRNYVNDAYGSAMALITDTGLRAMKARLFALIQRSWMVKPTHYIDNK